MSTFVTIGSLLILIVLSFRSESIIVNFFGNAPISAFAVWAIAGGFVGVLWKRYWVSLLALLPLIVIFHKIPS